MTTDHEDDGVISRWSKRKRGIAAEQEEVLSAEEIDLETIDEESDLSVFMKAGVPEALKKQALAVLWRSNPVFANIDGLNDYDEDFGSSDLVMKTFKSAYQAGKGYLEKEPETEEETLTAEVDDELQEVDGEEQIAEEETVVEEMEAAEEVIEPEQADGEEEVAEVATQKVSLRQRLIQEG
jgi:hypothetical protein